MISKVPCSLPLLRAQVIGKALAIVSVLTVSGGVGVATVDTAEIVRVLKMSLVGRIAAGVAAAAAAVFSWRTLAGNIESENESEAACTVEEYEVCLECSILSSTRVCRYGMVRCNRSRTQC